MAEFMNQNDVRQLLSFIYDCFLTRALGVDPASDLETDSDGSESECFMSLDLQAVGLLLMWVMILSCVPLMNLIVDHLVPV
jgi:hypothetical protein